MGAGNVAMMPWADFGLDMYSMSIMASEKTMAEKSKTLRAFLEAAYMGWRDVMADPKEALTIFKKRVPEIDVAIIEAEFYNYRKRLLKEQTDAVERASVPATQRLLEVLDDFELALMSANDKPDFDRFLHGVELVYAKLADTLKAEGLERIDALGKPFDPEQHEALMQTGEGEHLVVADVLRPGYTLRGRVIRPAGVRVNRE
jgi:molecular chaperone GrpE (heat shock protein)